MKLSQTQRLLLLAIEQECIRVSGFDAYWTPPDRWTTTTIKRTGEGIVLSGGGIAASVMSLERRGLIQKPEGAETPYAYMITEAGRELVKDEGNRT